MSNQKIIEEEFEKAIKDIEMKDDARFKEICKYFFVRGLRCAPKLKKD